MKRLLALLLALTLCLGLFGCKDKDAGEVTPSPAPSDVQEETDFLPDNAIDVAQELVGVPGSYPMLTVDGQEVTAEEFLYWLGNLTSYYEMMLSYSGQSLDLSAEVSEGVTWSQQLKEVAYQNVLLMALTPGLAEELDVSLSAEDVEELAANRARNIQSAGSREMYAYQLQGMGLNDTTAFELDKLGSLFSKVQTAYIDQALADGSVTAETVAQYAADNDVLRAKHILLLTKDVNTGEAYDEETAAQQKAKADDLLAQLRADPEKFDELMNANSEDSGLANYPDGYVFTAGDMVSAFEEGTRALEYGEISGVIPSEYGYHIILRLDPDCDETRRLVAEERFNEMVAQRTEAAQVTKSPEYEALTTADYYPKLKEFQTNLPLPNTQDESHASLQPDETAPSAQPEG